jgi:hypothetical protein
VHPVGFHYKDLFLYFLVACYFQELEVFNWGLLRKMIAAKINESIPDSFVANLYGPNVGKVKF